MLGPALEREREAVDQVDQEGRAGEVGHVVGEADELQDRQVVLGGEPAQGALELAAPEQAGLERQPAQARPRHLGRAPQPAGHRVGLEAVGEIRGRIGRPRRRARREEGDVVGRRQAAPPSGRPGAGRRGAAGRGSGRPPGGGARAERACLHQLQQVPQLVPLGLEVGGARLGGRHLERDALDDLQAVAREADVLVRVVGHQPHAPDPQVAQDLGADAVVALVRPEAELLVRLDRVVALLLELVGPELVDQPDAAALLEEIEDHPPALLGDQLEGAVELAPAVAALRAEDVAGQALAVDPHQDRLGRVGEVAVDQRQVLLAGDLGAVGVGLEVPVDRGQGGRRHALDQGLVGEAVADQVGHRDHRDVVLGGEAGELGHPRHGAVLVHDLADDARRLEPGQDREVDRGLGLAGALQDAPFGRPQREDVARAQEVVGAGGRVDRGPDGRGAVGRRDAGRDLAAGLDRDGEGGREGRGVLLDHQGQAQRVAALGGHRQADQPAAARGHEVDRFRSDPLGGDRQVPLVLALLVVDDDHEAAGLEGADRLLDRGEGRGVGHRGRVVALLAAGKAGRPRSHPRVAFYT